MGIKEYLDKQPNETDILGPVLVRWSRPGVGYGEFVIRKDDTGKLVCDNECMSREFIKSVLNDLVDKAALLE